MCVCARASAAAIITCEYRIRNNLDLLKLLSRFGYLFKKICCIASSKTNIVVVVVSYKLNWKSAGSFFVCFVAGIWNRTIHIHDCRQSLNQLHIWPYTYIPSHSIHIVTKTCAFQLNRLVCIIMDVRKWYAFIRYWVKYITFVQKTCNLI